MNKYENKIEMLKKHYSKVELEYLTIDPINDSEELIHIKQILLKDIGIINRRIYILYLELKSLRQVSKALGNISYVHVKNIVDNINQIIRNQLKL